MSQNNGSKASGTHPEIQLAERLRMTYGSSSSTFPEQQVGSMKVMPTIK